MPFSKVYKVPRVVNLTGFGLWTYNGMLLWMDDMLYLTAYGHGGCCNKSSVNQATRYRYRGCQLLPSRLCQSAQGFSDFLKCTLASDKLDEDYDSHHLIIAEYAGVLPGYFLQWLAGLEDKC